MDVRAFKQMEDGRWDGGIKSRKKEGSRKKEESRKKEDRSGIKEVVTFEGQSFSQIAYFALLQ